MAREPPLALHVAALAKNPSRVFRSVPVLNAAQLVAAAAMFVVGRVKSNLAVASFAQVPNETEQIPSGPGHAGRFSRYTIAAAGPQCALAVALRARPDAL